MPAGAGSSATPASAPRRCRPTIRGRRCTRPETWFPQSQAADASAANTCSGWDPNTDASADPANGYNLRQPTDSSDPRGTFFTLGDVIPLDWLNNHRDDILARLAPNLAVDPFATPDVRTSAYLQDVRQPGEAFLRLKDETARPLVAAGSSPVGNAVRAFRTWYAKCPGCSGPGWIDTAMAEDALWGCREKYLLVISDGADAACTGPNPNADAAALYSLYGVQTWVMAVGVTHNADTILTGLAQNGHGQILYSQSRQELVDNLNSFFLSIQP